MSNLLAIVVKCLRDIQSKHMLSYLFKGRSFLTHCAELYIYDLTGLLSF